MLKALDTVFDDETKEIVDRVINEFGEYTGRQIKTVMYSSPVLGKKKTIKEAKMRGNTF